jgi:Mg2+ and Co2+ transporter CorA
MGAMRLVLDRRDQGLPTEVGVKRLGELLADRENRLWLDISDPGADEVALLRQAFGFHELVLEDVTRAHERPRCDAYSGYYFIVVYAAEQSGDSILPRELNLFWGENYLVTIHRRSAAVLTALTEARRRWEHRERHQIAGVAGLAYTLFESLVDGYFVVQDRVRERIEGIEESIRLAGRRARRPRLLRVQPAGPYHATPDRDHRHHHGAELRSQHLWDELRPSLSAERIHLRIHRGRRVPHGDGSMGLHSLPDAGLALSQGGQHGSVRVAGSGGCLERPAGSPRSENR